MLVTYGQHLFRSGHIVQQHGLDIDFDFFLLIAMEASATRLVGYILVKIALADVEGI